MFYICTNFSKNIPKSLELLNNHDFTLRFTKGHNSINNVGGFMVSSARRLIIF